MSLSFPVSGDPHQLTRRLMAAAQIAAAALVGFGLILYVAANWQQMSRFAQFGLIGGILGVAGVAAMLWRPARVPGSLVAFAATGGLLALIGITYQTGADPWQLFALWAALTVPLAIAARHDVLWTAWVLVASTTLPLWLLAATGQPWGGAQLMPTLLAWVVAAAMALFLSPWAGLEPWIGRTRWAFRLAVSLLLALVVSRAVMALWTSGQAHVFLLGLMIVAGALAAVLLVKPLDFSLLAVTALAADVLLISALWRMFFTVGGRGDGILIFLILGLASAGIVIATVRALISAARDAAEGRTWQGGISPVGDLPEGLSRWPAILLSGFGALMASSPFLFLYGLLFGNLLTKGIGPLVIGAATVAGGIALARNASPYGFRQIFGLIALIVGAVVLGIWLIDNLSWRAVALVYFLISLGVAYAIPARWIAALAGWIAAGAAVLVLAPDPKRFVSHHLFSLSDAFTLPVMFVAAAGAAVIVALSTMRIAALEQRSLTERAQSFALGWTASSLLATMAVAGPTFLLGATVNSGAVSALRTGADLTTITTPRVFALLLAAAGIAAYIRARGDAMTMTGYAMAGVVLVMSYLVPPFAIAILVFGAMLLAGRRAGAALAAFAALWCVGSFYYMLGIPLVQKAQLLVALGIALGVAATWEGLLLPRLESATASGWSAGVAAGLIALSIGATAVSALSSIRTNEAVLASGDRIFVALAPVDPRSLMQGDFMALRFQLPQIPTTLKGATGLAGVASIDDRGVATIKDIVAMPYTDATPNVRPIELTFKGRWTIATDAFFFKEGTGQRYEAARFGEFRLTKGGKALLVGLADKDLVPIK